MKVAILTEGGRDIGFGHITRCSALCQAFKEKGIAPKLIVNAREDIGRIADGIDYSCFDWLKEDAGLNKEAGCSDIIIIDSYLARRPLYAKISEMAGVAVYLDDMNRLEYPKGVVVNGSFYGEDLNYSKRPDVEYLLGVRYAILRKEFWEVPEKEIGKDLKSVMVTFGGTDTRRMTLKIINFLNDAYPELKKLVIIGRGFQNIEEIGSSAGDNIELVYFATAEKMLDTMLRADIAVSSGGQTLYELARVGVPTIGICVAENQRIGLEKLQSMDLVGYIGSCEDSDICNKLAKAVDFLKDEKIRKSRSERARRLVDGKGCSRLIDLLKVHGDIK